MIHVYAFTAEPVVFEGLRGVDDAAVETVDCSPLHAVISHHGEAPSRDQAPVMEHGRVVEALAMQVPTLPVRFGSMHADVEALRATVADQLIELEATLKAVAGHVEFVVRAPASSAPSPIVSQPNGAASGRAYLESRLARERSERAVHETARIQLNELAGRLAGLATRSTRDNGPRGPEISYLVPAEHAERFLSIARQVCDGTNLVLGGPWAPYTFAGQAHDAA